MPLRALPLCRIVSAQRMVTTQQKNCRARDRSADETQDEIKKGNKHENRKYKGHADSEAGHSRSAGRSAKRVAAERSRAVLWWFRRSDLAGGSSHVGRRHHFGWTCEFWRGRT